MSMWQIFDNKLMGKPAPKGMTEGVPAKDKGRDNAGSLPLARLFT